MGLIHEISETHEAHIDWDAAAHDAGVVLPAENERDEYESVAIDAMREAAKTLPATADWGDDDDACLRVAEAGEAAINRLLEQRMDNERVTANVAIQVSLKA